ncbi:[FeFe] hydrogenase H-cluster maturation GTPase HydF [Clostridium sp. BJN0001]|uniref:[FeFe] hydrogenase H-cluster maturation GTPase HydF n=1 Tax=Clostridium sp. BJN0001 TaxID=2930219 RepID=UPI001FD30FBF|nr:[FeFe] hydrogenase H-cluster maturation GTPase HydF [Clostridium sp. BJN0001]
MNNTPNANRKHISIFGKTNSGKSSLMNKITGQDISVVSKKEGTTTDPVMKAMELIPAGPVLFIDTAGIGDTTELGKIRINKTFDILKRTDIAVYLSDINDIDEDEMKSMILNFKKYNIPYILVFNKVESVSEDILEKVKSDFSKALFISVSEDSGIEELKKKISDIIMQDEEEPSLISGLVEYGSKVILVVPVDSEAPKGRLILPQVQCLRDLLDNGIKSYVLRDTELESALSDIKPALVITDSQAFKKVSEIVPKDINITGFSMLFARQKGDIKEYLKGADAIKNLKKCDNVLITECCTHNVSHEDIGRVKIPSMLKKYVGGDLNITFMHGHDFDFDVQKYKLIIHCGACMVNRKTVINRINLCKEKNVPITNYGVALSFLTGTLDRSRKIFSDLD